MVGARSGAKPCGTLRRDGAAAGGPALGSARFRHRRSDRRALAHWSEHSAVEGLRVRPRVSSDKPGDTCARGWSKSRSRWCRPFGVGPSEHDKNVRQNLLARSERGPLVFLNFCLGQAPASATRFRWPTAVYLFSFWLFVRKFLQRSPRLGSTELMRRLFAYQRSGESRLSPSNPTTKPTWSASACATSPRMPRRQSMLLECPYKSPPS